MCSEKIWLGDNFIKRAKALLNNQKWCVLNEGTTTQYFKLEQGAR